MKNKLAISILAASAVGCGGGGSGGSGSGSGSGSPDTPSVQTATISGSLGQFRNASVMISDRDQVRIGEITETDANGQAQIELPSDIGPFIVEILGDADAEYFDEATQDWEAFEEGEVLRAALPGFQAEIGVTTLTELAVSQLESAPSGLQAATVASITAANEAIRALFMPGLGDITQPPTLVSTNNIDLGLNFADVYALILAGLAEHGDSGVPTNTPALSLMKQLSEDFSDGIFDQQINGESLSNMVTTFTPTALNSSNGSNSLFDNFLQIAAGTYLADGINVVDLLSTRLNGLPGGTPIDDVDLPGFVDNNLLAGSGIAGSVGGQAFIAQDNLNAQAVAGTVVVAGSSAAGALWNLAFPLQVGSHACPATGNFPDIILSQPVLTPPLPNVGIIGNTAEGNPCEIVVESISNNVVSGQFRAVLSQEADQGALFGTISDGEFRVSYTSF